MPHASPIDTPVGARLPGVATLFGLFGEDLGRIHEVTRVEQVKDRVSADSCEALRIGMTVGVGFQARGCSARRGVVEACELRDGGWRVTVRLEFGPAA